jgi:hypothetical protein
MRFQVLAAASTTITVFWDAASCSLINFTDVSEVFGASVNFYQTTRRRDPEDTISSDQTTSSVSASCSRVR